MRLLHVASFAGNYGDLFSHIGLYTALDEILKIKYSIEQCEIRHFYQNATISPKSFNKSFADYCNTFDLILVGGGGFLKQDFPTSTGTTFQISDDFYGTLKTRLIFTSIGGVRRPVDASELNNLRLERFVDVVLNHSNMHLLIRNDGSHSGLSELNAEFSCLDHVTDNAFFLKSKTPRETGEILVNLGGDQMPKNQGQCQEIRKQVASELVEAFNCKRHSTIRFIPHTYHDLPEIFSVLKYLPDDFARYHVKIEGVCFSPDTINKMIEYYLGASKIFAGRFHANVLGMLSKGISSPVYSFDRVQSCVEHFGFSFVPFEPLNVVGLNSYPQVRHSFDTLARTILD